jgi:hypothetical protein
MQKSLSAARLTSRQTTTRCSGGSIPIELIRASLTGQTLTKDARWNKFYQE